MKLKAKIMIVEDNYIIAKELQDTLIELSYSVTDVVDNGNEAVKLAGINKPDLILMDIHLKGNMDGIEAASIIRDEFSIPIIFITTHADDYTIQRAKRIQPSGYIIKPVKKKELYSSIEMALYKQAIENYLKKREEFLSITLKSISDAVITTDSKGLVNFINPIAENLLGYNQDEIFGKSLLNFINFENGMVKEDVVDPVKKTLETGNQINLENVVFLSKRGKKYTISITASPIKNDRGIIDGTVVILHDDTKKKKLYNELIRAHKIEALADLAGKIGHEFNNLLTVIIGNIELIKQRTDFENDISENLEEAEIAMHKAKDIAKQLLDLSYNGKLNKRIVDLRELLQDVIKSVLSISFARYQLILPENLWNIEADITQISRVFNKVLNNAFTLSSKTGKIIIQGENIEIDESSIVPISSGKYIKITIKEHNISMTSDQLNNVFEPLFSIDDKSSTFIDLAAAYSILKRHGGYITVESGEDEGVSFVLYLPAIQEKVLKDKEPAPLNNKKTKRILVMEDQDLVRIIIVKMLNHLGYEVEYVKHGRDAIDIYSKAIQENNLFDCVILDLTVAFGMGAKDTIKRLLEIDPKVKAIVSSGYINDPIVLNYRDIGFKGKILKPYDLFELEKTVIEVMEEN